MMREGGKLQGGALDAAQKAVMQAFRAQEMAIVAGMINFWFLDRVIRKNKGL
jgi:hypothetical protein